MSVGRGEVHSLIGTVKNFGRTPKIKAVKIKINLPRPLSEQLKISVKFLKSKLFKSRLIYPVRRRNGSISILQKAHRLKAWGYIYKAHADGLIILLAHAGGLCLHSCTLLGCWVKYLFKIGMLSTQVEFPCVVAVLTAGYF